MIKMRRRVQKIEESRWLCVIFFIYSRKKIEETDEEGVR